MEVSKSASLSESVGGTTNGTSIQPSGSADGSELQGNASSSNGILSASYSLFDNPPNVGNVRQRLFEIEEQIELSVDDFTTYWPFVDNIWVKQRSTTSKEGHISTDYYMCRLRRPTVKPSSRPTPEGKKSRKKQTREGGKCQMQLKVVKFEGVYSSCTITRMAGKEEKHSHDLDHIDKIKRNSAVMDVGRREAVKGYLPSSIFTKLREEPQRLEDAGGKFMSVTDVRNVQHVWRVEHPEVELKPHEGYEYQQGNGIVRIKGIPSLQISNDSSTMAISPTPGATQLPPNTLHFPVLAEGFLQPFLPVNDESRELPHVTLTYATSLDSKISLAPGVQTVLSGPESKAMTHYLRSKHDAILIGVRTALADDPGLNCRLEGAGGFGGLGRQWQPRPIIVDPMARWQINPESRLLKTVREGKGKAPWIVVSPGAYIDTGALRMLKSYGGDYLKMVEYNHNWRLRWEPIFAVLAAEGIRSVMIEGGRTVLSELLNPEYSDFIDSVIVTVAPTYLGKAGVDVSPDPKVDDSGRPIAPVRLRDVKWQPMGEDVIMCGKLRNPPPAPMLIGVESLAEEDVP